MRNALLSIELAAASQSASESHRQQAVNKFINALYRLHCVSSKSIRGETLTWWRLPLQRRPRR